MQPHSFNLHNALSGSLVVPSLETVASRQLRSATVVNRLITTASVEGTQPPVVSTRSRFSDEGWEKNRPQTKKLWHDEGKSL